MNKMSIEISPILTQFKRKKERYLKEGDNGVKIVLELLKRNVLKSRASISKRRIVRSKENRHRQWRFRFGFLSRRKNFLQHFQCPSCVIPTIPS